MRRANVLEKLPATPKQLNDMTVQEVSDKLNRRVILQC
jgi:hypothetical protein